ncbi:RDD family protein [Staphylococcus microti]|uniref:RDD family protein n=1 Tax=Staphylococcus microti TaxID=569857 RepID=A0A380GVJ0_9STAP|nr:RDD family protein [Staphylococcus microti]PNZ76944.1 RDD family protein [Staphylococcus microti]SUM57740.1 RDD family protein [Staphylococcus microti]
MTEIQNMTSANPTSNRYKQAAPSEATAPLSMSQYELDAFLYAGFGRRFFSYIIDIIILWAVTQLILTPLFTLTGMDEWELWISYFNVANMLKALLYFAYFVLMTRYFQQTLGKMILGIKVYTNDITALSWSDVLIREWIGRIISNVVMGLPYLAVIFTPKHIGVHDYFADTVVVKQKYLKHIQASRNQIRANQTQSRYNDGETHQ